MRTEPEAVLPLTHSDDSVDGRSDTYKPTWTRNRRLVYATNFAHMTMYTMCLGGVFDIFLYNLSMDVHRTLQRTKEVQANSEKQTGWKMSSYILFAS